MPYRAIDPEKLVETVDKLKKRIDERFPASGLSRVASEVRSVTVTASSTAAWMARPHWPIRVAVGLCCVAFAGAVLSVVARLRLEAGPVRFVDLAQAIDASINDIVFIGAAIYFLFSWETRLKRRRALRALHELRSLSHVIDMHQLTKDPERITSPDGDTSSSPRRAMRPFELARYLDYCSEMLAIIGKIAALYGQDFVDPVTLAAVNEVESLTTGLSRKIWQKISVLERVAPARPRGQIAAPPGME